MFVWQPSWPSQASQRFNLLNTRQKLYSCSRWPPEICVGNAEEGQKPNLKQREAVFVWQPRWPSQALQRFNLWIQDKNFSHICSDPQSSMWGTRKKDRNLILSREQVNDNNNNHNQRGKSRFFLQPPLCATHRLQHVLSSGPDSIVCKWRATHRALITCNMWCYVSHVVKGQLSYYGWQSWNRIYFSWCLFRQKRSWHEGHIEMLAPSFYENETDKMVQRQSAGHSWILWQNIEGFQPEWYIPTIYHAWDTPFWSGTLDMDNFLSRKDGCLCLRGLVLFFICPSRAIVHPEQFTFPFQHCIHFCGWFVPLCDTVNIYHRADPLSLLSHSVTLAGMPSQGADPLSLLSHSATLAGMPSQGADPLCLLSHSATLAGMPSQGADPLCLLSHSATLAGMPSQGADPLSLSVTLAGMPSKGADPLSLLSHSVTLAGMPSQGADPLSLLSQSVTLASMPSQGADPLSLLSHSVTLAGMPSGIPQITRQ